MFRVVSSERRSSGRARRRIARAIRTMTAVALLGAGAAGCDGASHPPDAHAPPNVQSAEVFVRFDASPGAGKDAPTVQVLAFRASVAPGQDLARPDVLGIVDPLAAKSPPQGCATRDVDAATRALGAGGASIELEELTGIGVGLGDGAAVLRPFPRLYPDVAAVAGGVVAEAGPQPVASLPDRVRLYTADAELPLAELAVPAAAHIAAVNGSVPTPAMRIDSQEPLAITVAGGAGGVVEVRPYGATVAIACAIPPSATPEATVVVPRPLLTYLMGASARAGTPGGTGVAASLEVARRSRIVQALGAQATRISVEVRTSTTVELRP
jgi:hypothetical protein